MDDGDLRRNETISTWASANYTKKSQIKCGFITVPVRAWPVAHGRDERTPRVQLAVKTTWRKERNGIEPGPQTRKQEMRDGKESVWRKGTRSKQESLRDCAEKETRFCSL